MDWRGGGRTPLISSRGGATIYETLNSTPKERIQ
jgi:hypothetical protein